MSAPELTPMHEAMTPSGLFVADPDQGIPFVRADLLEQPGFLAIWETFPDETDGGHNLHGFLERWDEFVAGDAPRLWTTEPRFGLPVAIERSTIPYVCRIGIDYWKREDSRAGVRRGAVAVPAMLGPGGELLIPR